VGYLGAKQETIMFLAVAISAGCYYCMWSGFGVNKKLDSAGNTRMVFFGHFVDRLFSMPLVIYSLCLVANAEMGETILLLGLDMLMVLCSAIGATQLHPWKWIWSLPLLSLSLPPFWQTSPLISPCTPKHVPVFSPCACAIGLRHPVDIGGEG